MKNNYQIFYESLIRASAVSLANSDSHFDRMLSEGSLSLLLEEFTNKDAQSLSAALKKQKEITVSVSEKLPKSMKNTKSVLDNLAAQIDGVSSVEEIAIMSQKGDTKGLKKKIEDLNTVFMRVSNLTAAVVQTMINAADNLKPVADKYGKKDKKDQLLNLTMTELKSVPGKKKEFEMIQKILKAVSDSYAVPDWQKSATEKGAAAAQEEAGGMWGAVKGFFKSIFGQVVEKALVGGRDAFNKDLSELSINAIIEVKGAMESARSALAPVSETAAQGSADATASTAAASGGGASSPAASAESTAASASGVASAASAAGNQALGKTLLDIIRKFAEPYKDNRAARGSLDDLVRPTRELLGAAEDGLYEKMIELWDKWSESLDDKAKLAIYGDGDPDSEEYKENKIKADNAVDAAIKKAIEDNLKMESRRKLKTSQDNLLSESRWAQLAGITKDNKR
jgi:uncharacterized protein YoxC